MTKFLSDNFKKDSKETLKKVEVFQRILPESKLEILSDRFEKFEEKYNKKISKIMKENDIDNEQDAGKTLPINEAILTFDNRQVIIIETSKIEQIIKNGEPQYEEDEDENQVFDEDGDPKPLYRNAPIVTKNTEYYWWPTLKFKLGAIKVTGHINIIDDIFDSEINALITGNFSIQYHLIGKSYDPEFCFATFESMYKDQFDVEEIPEDVKETFIEGEHYDVSYSLFLMQVVETW